MGNCNDYMKRCFGRSDRRSYLRSRYRINDDFAIEFDNLMDNEDSTEERRRLLTDEEKTLLSERRFDTLVQEQRRIDAQIDSKLAQEEEDLRLEEESYYEAKREAARVSNLQQQQHKEKLTKAKNKAKQKINKDDVVTGWASEEWDVANDEDDFELFLERVRSRSLSPQKEAPDPVADKPDLTNQDTETTLREEVEHLLEVSSSEPKSRSQTESSINLEWEHEPGVKPNQEQTMISESDSSASKNDTKENDEQSSGVTMVTSDVEITIATKVNDEYEWADDDELLTDIRTDTED